MKTVCMLAIQMISLIQKIHEKGIIHRDIKPENMMMGRKPNQNILYIVDFGISKYYQDNFNKHIPFKTQKPFIGTCRYASSSSHLGHELSRKDDLESLGYVLIFMCKSKLPWQNLNLVEKEKIKKVGKMKQNYPLQDLCYDLPNQFLQYFIYVKSLGFHQKPKYDYLQDLFSQILLQRKYSYDFKWDWINSNKKDLKTLSMLEVPDVQKDNKKHNSFVQINDEDNKKEKVGEIYQRVTKKKLSNFLEPPKMSDFRKKKRSLSKESADSGSASINSLQSLQNKYVPSLLIVNDEINENANEDELREYLGKNMRQMLKDISKCKY